MSASTGVTGAAAGAVATTTGALTTTGGLGTSALGTTGLGTAGLGTTGLGTSGLGLGGGYGGLGSAYGALVGGFVVGILVEMSTLVVPSELKNAPALIILIIVLIVRPQGILGRRQRVG